MGITFSVICFAVCNALIGAESISFVTSASWTLGSGTARNSSSSSSHNQQWQGNHGIKANLNSKYIWSSSGQNDLDLKVNITLNEVARGAKRLLDSSLLSALCPLAQCSVCGGKGILNTHSALGNSVLIETASYPCPACAGWGKLPTKGDCLAMANAGTQHAATYEMAVNILKLFIPPNTSKGDTILYRPFESPFINKIPSNNSLSGNESTMREKSKNHDVFGPIRLIIEDITLPTSLVPLKSPQSGIQDLALQSTRLFVEEKQFHLVVPISPMEATFGFSRAFHLFEDLEDVVCESLQINREGKPTLPGSSVAISLQALFDQLCHTATHNETQTKAKEDVIDPNEYLLPYNQASSREYVEGSPQTMLNIQFQVLNASTYQDAFMNYWHCSIVDIVEPVEVTTEGNEDEIIDLDAPMLSDHFLPPPEPVVRQEISCAETEFENERNNMFMSLQANQEADKKYNNWLDFLTRI